MTIKNVGILASVMLSAFCAMPARAATEVFSATLLGDNEVPPINTSGEGTFQMENNNGVINFTLTFSGLSSNLTVSHLHFAPTKVSGGVMIFLCGGGNQPACPAAKSGSITGTIVAGNVTGPTTQGISVGDLTSALEAVGEGSAYANIHTTQFGVGEIRGQVRRGNKHKDSNGGNGQGDAHKNK
ncbi:MAG: CHRD domain-containing protein [Acidobacteriota bacterium]